MQINSELERILLEQGTSSTSTTSTTSTSNAFSNVLGSELSSASETEENDAASVLAGLQNKATTNSLFAGADIEALQDEEAVEAVAASGGASIGGGVKAGGVSKNEDDEDDDEESTEYDLIEGLTDTLDELETYANSVQNATTLKEAWASLDTMIQNIEEMQEQYANQSRQNPNANSSMGTLLNELETLAVTETHKFNRGDYL